jgi:hypothetical protein
MAGKKEARRGRSRKYRTERQRKKAAVETVSKYQKKAMTGFTFRFHNENDREVIEKLGSVVNKSDYVRQLIIDDIKKGGD